MSKRERLIIEMFDDLDARGGLETPADDSFTLAVNGYAVEFDLSGEHAKEFTEAVRPYLEIGRRITQRAAGVGPNKSTMGAARKRNKRIQQWGLEQGGELATMAVRAIGGGHRSLTLVHAYEAAHPEDVL